LKIIAYEFYLRDTLKGYQLVGILPERRKDPKRKNRDSIRKWGKKLIGESIDSRELFFIQVTIDRETGRIYPRTAFSLANERYLIVKDLRQSL
jgi:hypothetical protein